MKRHTLGVDSRTKGLGVYEVSVVSHTDKYSKIKQIKTIPSQIKISVWRTWSTNPKYKSYWIIRLLDFINCFSLILQIKMHVVIL